MKTIEEYAKQFTDELFAHDDLSDFDTQTVKNDAYVLCMTFGNHLMAQPLADRLTAEEREKIKKLYLNDEELEGVKTAFGTYPVAVATITKNMLEHIFGKAMFAEEGGEK